MTETPKILAFIRDLNFALRIENTVQRIGFEVIFLENAEQLGIKNRSWIDPDSKDQFPNRNGILLDQITSIRPALIIFDLSNDLIPWREWISLISTDPSTRRVPLICYGPHVDVDRFEAATQAGAELVISRSRFVNSLPNLLTKYAKYKTKQQLEEMCEQPLSGFAIQGLEEFNRGEYFEAHESLELAWLEDHAPGRDVYRAALQVAVAYYQVTRGNYRGAKKMFLRLRQWLDPLPDVCRGINISQIRAEAERVYQELISLGPENLSDFDQNLLRPIEYQGES